MSSPGTRPADQPPLLQIVRRPFDGRRPLDALAGRIEEAADLYRADAVPWVVGFSAGKDSTAALTLVWHALRRVPEDLRTKPVYVTTTDTGVENPVVAAYARRQHALLAAAAAEQRLPVHPRLLHPAGQDTFWVNLIGRGMAAPRPKFRWCTDRLKIRPNTAFIRQVVAEHGQSLLVLGTRKTESAARAASMRRAEQRGRVADRLTVNASLPNGLVYTPVEDLRAEEVWQLLLDAPCPWGGDNKELMALYAGSSDAGECPVVVDSSTSSCGGTRTGCWTCTMVEVDKSLSALIANGEGGYDWLIPLRDLRDELDAADDRHLRDYVRARGGLTVHRDRLVHGQYTESARHHWLRQLLEAQEHVRAHGPDWVRDIDLVTAGELAAIRRIWVLDKHEMNDALPGIFEAATGRPYPGPRTLDDLLPAADDLLAQLRELCAGDREHFEMVRDLIDVERRHRTRGRRTGLYDDLEAAIARRFYTGEDDALARARLLHPPPAPQPTLFDPDPLLDARRDGTPAGPGPPAR